MSRHARAHTLQGWAPASVPSPQSTVVGPRMADQRLVAPAGTRTRTCTHSPSHLSGLEGAPAGTPPHTTEVPIPQPQDRLPQMRTPEGAAEGSTPPTCVGPPLQPWVRPHTRPTCRTRSRGINPPQVRGAVGAPDGSALHTTEVLYLHPRDRVLPHAGPRSIG